MKTAKCAEDILTIDCNWNELLQALPTIDGITYYPTTNLGKRENQKYWFACGANKFQTGMNLLHCINRDGYSGIDYSTATTAHPTVKAEWIEAGPFESQVRIIAKEPGSKGNLIKVSLEPGLDNGSWATPHLTGGSD